MIPDTATRIKVLVPWIRFCTRGYFQRILQSKYRKGTIFILPRLIELKSTDIANGFDLATLLKMQHTYVFKCVPIFCPRLRWQVLTTQFTTLPRKSLKMAFHVILDAGNMFILCIDFV